MQAPLRERFRDLPEADMKEILHNRMWESKSYQTHEDHMTLYEALEKSMARDNSDQLLSDLAKARKKKKKRQGSPKTPPGSPPHPPPPPPPPAGPSGTLGASGASGSSKTAALAKYTAWTMTDTRLKPSVSSIPEELHMDDDTTADEQAYSSSGEDVGRDHIPTVNLRQRISELTQKDLEGPAYEIVKVFHPDVVHLQFQMEECHKLLTDQVDDAILRYNVSKPLLVGGDLGHVTIKPDFFFNKDLEYLLYGRKMGRPALSILKMKAAYYPDVGLEQMVSDQCGLKRMQKLGYQTTRRRLPVKEIESYQTQDKYGVQMIMRFNEIHKFNDGTLQQIDEALDYRVKEFKVNRMNPRTDKYGDSVGYTSDDLILILEILSRRFVLRMNLPDHRIKQKWRWRHLIPVESIHHPMLSLNASKERHHDN
ncbi:hypothetical protein Tco_0019207 [Tanacetum coccineum]